MIRLITLIIAALVFTGCAPVITQVSSFNETNTQELQGATFDVSAVTKEQSVSLESKQYAEKMSKYLIHYGMVPVPEDEIPKYLVLFTYGIDSGQTTSTSVPVYGQTGGGYSTFTGSTYGSGGYNTYSGSVYTMPTYGVVGSTNVTQKHYTRMMEIRILTNISPDKTPEIVYQAKAVSSGSSGIFAAVSDCIIQSIFDKFPGDRQESYRKTLVISSCGPPNENKK